LSTKINKEYVPTIMKKQNKIQRPKNTNSKRYVEMKSYILKWRQDNEEYVRTYNREYQRELRKDPIKYEELQMRVRLRQYLTAYTKNSYKIASSLGMTRSQMAEKHGMTEPKFIEMVKTNHIDHIISNRWFDKMEMSHLKPFVYRHYNIQFVTSRENQQKHSFVDLDDIRIQSIILQMKMDYAVSKHDYSKQSCEEIEKLSSEFRKMQTVIKHKYK
jgi:hypothetical protein